MERGRRGAARDRRVSMPSASSEEVQELAALVASIRFVED
jgi:hypothetical protein